MLKMKPSILAFVCMIFFFGGCAHLTNQKNLEYPTVRMGSEVDEYFGTKVEDPFRWMEDDRSEETAAFVEAQNKVTFAYLEKIPFRNDLKTRLEKVWNYEKIGIPWKEGEYTYYSRNSGLQNQSVIYRKDAAGKEEVFLDPNTFSKDGTTSLGGIDFSRDGSIAAYSISEGGSDWRKVFVMDAKSKTIIDITLVDVKFSSISWKGNEGFYYSSYDKPKGSELSAKTDQHKLYFHKLGTSQKDDVVVFGNASKRRYVGGQVTEDDRYLIITASQSTSGNELYVKDLSIPNAPIVNIVNNFENDHEFIDNEGDTLFIETDLNAPNKRLVKLNIKEPNPKNWKDVIPETDFAMSLSKGGGYLFAKYLKDALSVVKQYDHNGIMVREIKLPGLGTANGFSGKKKDQEVYFAFTNYTTPTTIFSLQAKSGTSEVFAQPKVDFKSDQYESKQVFYSSKDGTKVPMMITHKKGLILNGKNPTLLYGYGGFNINITPSFSISNVIWLEQGGVYAVPNLRGGGEYGKKWHEAGTKMQKQNVFDDFIAAAEYLIANKYTSSDFLAIEGRSNGGLLVGATMTQRPDLMKVALPGVGVLDMLRYHTFTAGAGWAFDYGTANDSKEMFNYLKGYSPLHNVRSGTHYPATMITTADHDDRVVPAHSFKFAAELQKEHSGTNPILLRVDVKAGHGAGKSVSASILENVDRLAFMLYNMGFRSLPSQ